MKWLHNLFDSFRPHFEPRGSLGVLKPLFEAVEFIFLLPAARTANAPHVRDPMDLKRYMTIVIVALMPSIISAVYFFGPRVLLMILVSYVVGGIVEVCFACIRKTEVHEGFFVTGMIFPLILPPATPLWVVAVGIFFGVFFGKEVFGGTGHNVFNPALVGRLFVTIAFPTILTSGWTAPGAWRGAADAVTSATPMAMAKTQGILSSANDLLLGTYSGSVGETFHLGIILGGVFLMLTKVSDWRIPISYIGSVFVFAFFGTTIGGLLATGENTRAFGEVLIAAYDFGVFQVLAGSLLFGAMFMVTDPVTSPVTKVGKWIFGILCGLLTLLIRVFSGYVEGVMFSIVIMNAATPLIDHIVLSIKYKKAHA
ncbi:MAG: RnfABCDGE type electron transport complex subunit D [Desulfocapsaceae bacterium]|jgi:RnfABCDGE-type electron transport complex D subunit|nr:RnfABCDGE type electron transport complex subunit D [Desulfocapsaceae bacterium]